MPYHQLFYTHKGAWRSIAEGQRVDDLCAAAESRLRLQDVEAFVEVNCESLPQQESLREGLEGLSVPNMPLLLITFL